MSKWNDYNTAGSQSNFDVIPAGTLAKVSLKIKPGGHDNEKQGWTGGWATQSKTSTSIFLNCEFTVMAGHYARRKIWSLIGLHSDKGETWANNGRKFIKAILDSANGLTSNDDSAIAQKARQIDNFGDLDGLVFLARLDVEADGSDEKNVIRNAITAEHKEYDIYMSADDGFPSEASPAPKASNGSLDDSGKPSWA